VIPRTNKLFRYSVACIGTLLLAACSTTKTLVVLLPEENGADGAVTVGEETRAAVLDVPLNAATVDARGNIDTTALTQEEVQRIFGEALAAQPPKPLSFTLYFDIASTEVTPESQPILEALFAEVAKRPAVEVQVTGHTDRVGTDDTNDRLSLERAQAVLDILIQRGLKTSFIRAVGRGEREPLIATPDEQPEPRNRRVEVIVR
jgi:OmpA-OmpF porin, OOP family